ncbi:MAG: hypothetical protein ACD_58C00050G0002 [uncultured bacterium]|nr:MAG: hypothetical protein ACD_58C00050G0002 [uncultured bacterium]
MIKKLLLTLILGLLVLPTFAKADGGFFPPDGQWMYEIGQKGAIFYQNNSETLVLQTSFAGDAKDFAWIIPTPSQPKVSKISDDFFTNLETLTQSENSYPVPMMASGSLNISESKDAVNVVEEKQLGIYEIKILSATSASALYDWLKENNYQYPESKKYILDDYITNKWFFTTAKITTSAITEDIQTKLKQGKLSPIKLVFEATNIVYPLKISAVTEVGHLDDFDNYYYGGSFGQSIELYIFSDHKKDINNFTTDYANWIKPNEINKLAKDDNGNNWVMTTKKMYLTKFYSYVPVADMTNDLFPDNAKNNDKVGVLSWWQKFSTWVENYDSVVLIIALVVFGLFCFWYLHKPISRIIKWLMIVIVSCIYIINLIDLLVKEPWISRVGLTNNEIVTIISYLSLPILLIMIMKKARTN